MKKQVLAELHTIKNWMKKLNITENTNKTDDPTKEDMINVLSSEVGNFEGMDKFSAEEAIYWYAYNNHGGQWSNLYSVLSTSEYKPSPLMRNIEDSDDEMSIGMYNTLVSNFGGEEIQLGTDEYDDEMYESTDSDTYENVVFLQGSEASEPLSMLDNDGPDAAIEFLTQWHNPGEHEGTNELGHGMTDKVYGKGNYILSWNTALGYIGLQYRINPGSNINETGDAIQNKNTALKQWFGPDSRLYLVTKPEKEWDEADYELYNRLLAMVQKDGQVPSYGKK